MPPIQPSGGIQTKSYIITSSDLLNDIVIIDTICSLFSGVFDCDNLYDGVATLQNQLTDGSWNDCITTPITNHELLFDLSTSTILGNYSFHPNFKYPFVIRLKITTKATQGTCNVVINYL